jgi:iron complex outermembrane receptor protein
MQHSVLWRGFHLSRLRVAAALGVAAVATGFVASTAAAQGFGAVEGVVVEVGSGEPFAGVRVYVEGTGQADLTDTEGRYRIARVPAGERVVVAEYFGQTAARQVVQVQAGGTARVDLRLTVNALPVSEIVVSVTGEARRKAETPATIGVVGGAEIREVKPAHPSEVINRVPGVWVNVTGGEGHITAIRQPKTTNPVYLYLEDGIPTRSTGFFNHNALYEVNVPQADRIEVLKGPATALYGSDAIGGVIDVATRAPGAGPALELTAEGGAHGWGRVLASASAVKGANGLRADFNLTRTDGWRDGTAYDRESGTLRWDRMLGDDARLKTVATFSRIDQQTAGSSALSRQDYLDRPTLNYTPISFRKVKAFRFSTAYEKVSGRSLLNVTPYARWNWMELLPNWSLTYDPIVSEVGHRSLGVVAKYRRDFERFRAQVIVGLDVDWSPGEHFERRIQPVRNGPIFESYTLADTIYDYDVTFWGISPYVHVEASPVERLRLTAGLRFDHVGYDYRNALGELTTGRHRRPASTEITYDHLSPKLGATYTFGPGLSVFAAYGHGFRAPSEGQLFRQGQALNTIGLKPVKADNVEVGLRGQAGQRVSYEVSVYSMKKTDDILSYTHPDGSQETVNAGETLHRGVELALGLALTESLRLDASYTIARHTYESWRPREGVDLSGKVMEEAPREIGHVTASYAPGFLGGAKVLVDWTRIGRYWMDAENTHEYEGHDVVDVRLNYPVGRGLALFGKLVNVTDERFAEGATYTEARGEEYAPGLPRTVYVGLQYTWGGKGGEAR